MFRQREEARRRLFEIVETFRQKGATSPDKAITAEELGLSARFEQAMHRRLGQLRIFVEVNGKYYLDENRLKEIQERRAKAADEGKSEGGWNRTVNPRWYRYFGLLLILPIGLIVSLVLYYLMVAGGFTFFPGEFLIILAIVLVLVTVARILFWRSRQRWWREQWAIEV